MCGIVGYAGRRNALPILLDGLKRLEYRGYDSAGVAIVGSGLQVVKDKGFIANLEAQLPPLIGSTGFAHTRWATHGAPSKVNAHPHIDCTGKLALADNGIIDNYAALREKLESRGHKFVSQTDTESLVHLIESYYEGNLEEATRKALHAARGSYAIRAIRADEPGKVVGARNESPLVVGVGPDENFLASDVPAPCGTRTACCTSWTARWSSSRRTTCRSKIWKGSRSIGTRNGSRGPSRTRRRAASTISCSRRSTRRRRRFTRRCSAASRTSTSTASCPKPSRASSSSPAARPTTRPSSASTSSKRSRASRPPRSWRRNIGTARVPRNAPS